MSVQTTLSPTGTINPSSDEKKPTKEKKKKIADFKLKKGRQHKLEDVELISSARKSNADQMLPTVDYCIKVDGQGNYFDKSFVISTLLPPITISEIDNLEPPKTKMSRYILSHYRNISVPPPQSALSPRPQNKASGHKPPHSPPSFESGTVNVKDSSPSSAPNTGTMNVRENTGTVNFKDFGTVNVKEGISNTGTINVNSFGTVKHNPSTTGTVNFKELGTVKVNNNNNSNSNANSSFNTGTVNVKDFGTVNIKHSPSTTGTVNFKELGTVKTNNNSGASGGNSGGASFNTGTMVVRDNIPTKQSGSNNNNSNSAANTNSFGTMVIKND